MPSRKKESRKPGKDLTRITPLSQQELQNVDCFEGERLSCLLKSMKEEIESERDSNTSLPDKLRIKQQFAVGVNEVTRVLERMSPSVKDGDVRNKGGCGFSICLQALMVAWDCNPRWLTKHLLSLAASRDVPIIYVKDQKQGSVRLGEMIGLRTAIAIGIKAKGSSINRFVETNFCAKELISRNEIVP